MGRTHRSDYPVFSHDGDPVAGERRVEVDGDVRAEDRWRAGTPPVHGLAKRAVKSARVGRVDIGDELLVIRSDKHWEVHDGRGYLGRLRWSAADDGKTDKRFHTVVDYPDRGTLMVIRLVIFGIDDKVIDFGGYVVPDASRP